MVLLSVLWLCVALNKPALFPFIAEAVGLSIGVNLVSEAVKCFPGSPRPAASSGARCTLLIILSTSSIQTYSGNTRPLIARDPFFTYCCTSSACPVRMWLTFFMVGGEKKIKQTGQPIKSNGTAAGQIETSSMQNYKKRKVSAEHSLERQTVKHHTANTRWKRLLKLLKIN